MAVSVTEAVDAARFRPLHAWLFLAAVGGTLLDGVSVFMTGLAVPLLRAQFAMGPTEVGLLGSALVLGAVFGAWAVARATSGFGVQGLLVGLVAMAIYLGLCSMAPGGVAAVIAGYGIPLFVTFDVLRTVGCVGGAIYRGARVTR